ncbi:MAG: hypothetical protein CL923_00055 [Deltaproteobacteria bacterium]|jgi:hypothetical protein|nr:hypothetical protein [Deltaproteobacteria bacterium]MBQ30956.1 hypothetical protein [Deltaproteobacteria bacterium]MDP7157764.1 hypothetical protein [SAR324 cluster bacterium]MDP7463100.1 hypothetical protein [SAR324 cluster bacterium]
MTDLEDALQQSWPSAVRGEISHPQWGTVCYWTGEQHGHIAVRFRYADQPDAEADKVFFVDSTPEGWVLRHVSSFATTDSGGLKLVKNQSFKVLDELEEKYRDLLERFMQERTVWEIA